MGEKNSLFCTTFDKVGYDEQTHVYMDWCFFFFDHIIPPHNCETKKFWHLLTYCFGTTTTFYNTFA